MLTTDVLWVEGPREGVRRWLILNSILLVWSLYGPNLALPYLVHSLHTKALCVFSAVHYLLVTSQETVFIVAFHPNQKWVNTL